MDESLLLRWRKGRAGELDPEERARLERDIEALFVEHEARVYAKCDRLVRDKQLEFAQDVPLRLHAHRLLVPPLLESDARALHRAVAPDADEAAVQRAVLASDGIPLALIAMAELPGADPATVGPWRTAMARAWRRLDPSQRAALKKLRELGDSFGFTEAESVLRADCDEQLPELVARGFLHDAGDGRWRMLGAVSRCVGGFAETTL